MKFEDLLDAALESNLTIRIIHGHPEYYLEGKISAMGTDYIELDSKEIIPINKIVYIRFYE